MPVAGALLQSVPRANGTDNKKAFRHLDETLFCGENQDVRSAIKHLLLLPPEFQSLSTHSQ
jgi:hypothetical protein